jgi:hypothetical protein
LNARASAVAAPRISLTGSAVAIVGLGRTATHSAIPVPHRGIGPIGPAISIAGVDILAARVAAAGPGARISLAGSTVAIAGLGRTATHSAILVAHRGTGIARPALSIAGVDIPAARVASAGPGARVRSACVATATLGPGMAIVASLSLRAWTRVAKRWVVSRQPRPRSVLICPLTRRATRSAWNVSFHLDRFEVLRGRVVKALNVHRKLGGGDLVVSRNADWDHRQPASGHVCAEAQSQIGKTVPAGVPAG